ncbi:MAG TPA: helix-turn-helix domain-containing protein [Ignavibacteria bacterium]|jgi:transcriptional regulator GlxA family with amidase domain|nr:helix-turn-helix domain-containing protein [Ignavibacteria bacterium]
MKNIIILVPEGAVLASIADPQYMFTAANNLLIQSGRNAFFNVILAGLTREVKLLEGKFSINTDCLLDEVVKADLILIPALSGDMKQAIELNREFIPWITSKYKDGAEVASLCVGAFLLAATGLMKGKQCSTHWLYVNQFRAMFPDIDLIDEKIITEQNGLYSSGGANSYWNLLLYLLEKYTDRETAIMASKFFVLDIARKSQSPFTIFHGQKDHGDEEVKKAQEYIENNYNDKLTVDRLSDLFGIGRRTFERRFKKATNNTVIEYTQRVKIEAAKKELEQGRKNVNEVMFDVGYTDTKAFRDVFRKITGMSPIDYRNRYNR